MTEDRPSFPIAEHDGMVSAAKSPPVRTRAAKCRVVVPLNLHSTVTVTGVGLDLDGFIGALEDALGRARKARNLRVSLSTFIQMLADQSHPG